MLGIVALIFIIILSVKLSLAMNKHCSAMLSNEIPLGSIRAIQMSPLLYIISLVAFVLPISWLVWLAPIPFGFLLLVPGIMLGKKFSMLLERSGTDVGVEAGRTVSNIMWLGIGVALFIAGNIAFSLMIPSVDDFMTR
jgi:hypothetical protein